MDTLYIEEIKSLGGVEAKSKLAEYARDTFNITIKKSMSFDNMVEALETELSKLADEPLPEDNNGLSTSELMIEESKINNVESQIKSDEIIDTPKSLPDVTETIDDVVDVVADGVEKVVEKVADVINIEGNNNVVKDIINIVPEIITPPKPKKLNFSPTPLLGNGSNAYMILPWWVYDWVMVESDWKEKINDYPQQNSVDILESLKYYIERDGFVKIRETRNSSFHIIQ